MSSQKNVLVYFKRKFCNIKNNYYLCIPHRGVEQLVARRAHNPEAGGSSPSPATRRERSSIELLSSFYLSFAASAMTDSSLSRSIWPSMAMKSVSLLLRDRRTMPFTIFSVPTV